MLRTGAIVEYLRIKKTRKINCLARERNFLVSKIMNFEDVPRGSVIFENRGAPTSHIGPHSTKNLKGERMKKCDDIKR